MLPHYLVKHYCQKTSEYDKLQGSVATYLRRGEVVNNQIKKDSLVLSLSVNKILKSANIWRSYKQERGCLVQFERLTKRPNSHRLARPDKTVLSVPCLPRWCEFDSRQLKTIADRKSEVCTR